MIYCPDFPFIFANSGSRSALVVNTMTVEIVVTDAVNDSDFDRLRQVNRNTSKCCKLKCQSSTLSQHAFLNQISGAKVTVQEPRPGTAQRTVVISGTPHETQAAQSLLQAFILSGS